MKRLFFFFFVFVHFPMSFQTVNEITGQIILNTASGIDISFASVSLCAQ